MQSTPEKNPEQQRRGHVLYDPLIPSGHVLRVPRPDFLGTRQEHRLRQFDMTYADRFAWPEFVWGRLSGHQRDRLLRNLKRLVASSHMSGCGGMELILWQVGKYINDELFNRGQSALHLRTLHSCDKARACLAVLSSMDSCCKPMHVHRNIEHRLPLPLAMELEDMVPSANVLVDAQR